MVLSIKALFLNMELYLKTTVVKICIRQCDILMFSKRVPSNIWENIFVIYFERKDVEFYVCFNGMRISLKGRVYEKFVNLLFWLKQIVQYITWRSPKQNCIRTDKELWKIYVSVHWPPLSVADFKKTYACLRSVRKETIHRVAWKPVKRFYRWHCFAKATILVSVKILHYRTVRSRGRILIQSAM
jgi:hypothetical protein